ncbi:MAG TPA: CCA tRNA nucleotidyltransferase [Acidimicrobiales bacterium]|nr:CCA tRNA nucleotidyltransferase [Acidimicrobiales bacterium]
MIPARFRPVLDEVAPLGARFAESGHRLYLVGGVVRDLLSGRDLGDPERVDLDFTTDAEPQVTKALLDGLATALWTQGERFGTIGAKIAGRSIEITTHRGEAYRPDSRKPEVVFSSEITDDLARRDFTVNAMAIALPDPELIDPYEGAADLAARRLRTPLSPEESFSDDPLRMMRAARFIAGHHLAPDEALVTAATAMADRLSVVSAERIRDELDKLLVVEDPGPGLWFLVDTGLADEFLPELRGLRLEQDPIHRHKDVLAHTIAVVQKTGPRRLLRLAALLHDIGKPATRDFGANGVSFHHHEVVGARLAKARMKALRYGNDDIERVRKLVFLHLRFHTYGMGWTDSAVRRFVRDAGDELEDLIELTRCDVTTRNQRKAERLARRMDELEARIAELEAAEELASIRPDLDGDQIMAHLGISPGRDVGDALKMLLEARLDDGPLGEEAAYARLDAWWESRKRG